MRKFSVVIGGETYPVLFVLHDSTALCYGVLIGGKLTLMSHAEVVALGVRLDD